MRASHQRKLIVLNPQANTSGAAATAASRLATPPYPIAAAEYAIAGAWSPANAIEEHLVRKIGALGVTIENLLNHLSLLDPADPVKARIISSFSLTLTRLQKTQSTLEAELREVQAQRGIRATPDHLRKDPLTGRCPPVRIRIRKLVQLQTMRTHCRARRDARHCAPVARNPLRHAYL
jgi:hypothetical protein